MVWSGCAFAEEPTVLPKNDPKTGSGAREFDWQKEWGTIHMNSMADGLNDPGSLASHDGTVGCAVGAICASVKKPPVPGPKQISNGIKFDIKNSLLNCMSKPVTNWAINNPWDSDTTVCKTEYGLDPDYIQPQDPHTLVYLPIFDKRSNDGREWQKTGEVGCQQQVINNCVRDIHECVKSPSSELIDPSPGYLHPVTHIFSPDEVKDLGGKGAQLPPVYYSYTKDLGGGKTRIALSRKDPTDFADRVKEKEVKEIEVGSHAALKRLKAYRMGIEVYEEEEPSDKELPPKEPDPSKPEFIVVDPSDFFDLRLYTESGKYNTGYSNFDKDGLVATYDTCPVLGLKSGYSGICDPNGKAGCNLPIYGVGPKTEFTDMSGKTFTYNDYPIKWSAYVKKWAVISKAHYLENIRGREDLYLTDSDINDNAVLMLTREDDYCEDLERASNPKSSPPKADMPCVHYLQYQAVDDAKTDHVFVDLYAPMPANFSKWEPEYNTMQLYSLNEEGLPDLKKPVPGSGTDIYLPGGTGTNKGFVSFFDGSNPQAVYDNLKTGQEKLPAVWKASYAGSDPIFDALTQKRIGGPVVSTTGSATTGEYLGSWLKKEKKADTSKGTGIGLLPGTVSVIRFPSPIKIGGETASCVIATYVPTKPVNADTRTFIPTNTKGEFQSFVTASFGSKPPIEGLQIRKCKAEYMPNTDPLAGKPRVPGGAKTWMGMTSCNDLTSRPACNETRLISAQRYCQLENGSLDGCSSCNGSKDPDSDKALFAEEKVAGEILVDPTKGSGNRCYFSAACFNNSADGCPTSGSSGGHVFCLAAETKIVMADGKEKEIKKIKAGDKVKTFNAKNTRNGALSTGVVTATAVTKRQRIVQINDLKITPLHKIVLSTGRAVMAKDLKVGDQILKADGLVEEVTSIKTDLKPITVFNLVLEDGNDGYIANGLRVMSYPLLKEMQLTDGSRRYKRRGIGLQ